MTRHDLLLPLLGLLAVGLVMTAAWALQRRTRNAGVVDVLWAGSLGALAVFYGFAADGWAGRRILVAALAGAWSARLTWHLARRFAGEPEDGRYADLRARLGRRFDRWTFWFFQARALLAVLLSVAFLVPASAATAGWRVWDGVGLVLFAVSIVGEGIADRQLSAWRSDPANRGRTCRAGLWRCSRHPNYFFEWIHWLVYPVLGVGLPLGWTLWLAPALMLFLVLRVTGIPPTEAQSLRSRGEDYRDYQRTTNTFFPGPPRAAARPARTTT
jgi:steroid 5-alpha reductase family enzyme